MIKKLIQWFKRNACKDCDYYCPENDVTESEDIEAKMVEPQGKRCENCNHYGKFSLDCGRCDDNCSMYEPQESEDKE